VILATGSRPAAPAAMAPDHRVVLDSDDILELNAPPSSLAVIGGGAVGLELARFFGLLGAKIAVIELLDRLAPLEDPEVGKVLVQEHRRGGWDLFLGEQVEGIEAGEGQARIRLASGREVVAEKALVAVGRAPNSRGLGLESVGAATNHRGCVVVDPFLRASEGIYAVGDLNGLAQLAHAAADQGAFAARHAAGRERETYAPGPLAWCIYGQPETLRVGKTAADLVRHGVPTSVSFTPIAANPIAQAHAASKGFVKAIWAYGRLHGVVAVGHDVSRLATQAQIMVGQGWTPEDAKKLVVAHPTLDEALKEALLAPWSEVPAGR